MGGCRVSIAGEISSKFLATTFGTEHQGRIGVVNKKVGGTVFTPHPLFSVFNKQKIFRIVDYFSPPPERVRPLPLLLLVAPEERVGVLLRLMLLPEERLGLTDGLRLGLGLL